MKPAHQWPLAENSSSCLRRREWREQEREIVKISITAPVLMQRLFGIAARPDRKGDGRRLISGSKRRHEFTGDPPVDHMMKGVPWFVSEFSRPKKGIRDGSCI
jgi:hypothetical protein